MSLSMSKQERESFLKDLRVGVISIEQQNASPLSVPIWYDYSPEVGVWILTAPNSAKGQALASAGRYTLVAQDERPPAYRYVSVEGPISETRPADREKDSDRWPIATLVPNSEISTSMSSPKKKAWCSS